MVLRDGLRIGTLDVAVDSVDQPRFGLMANGDRGIGVVTTYVITDAAGLEFDVQDTRWRNGGREVAASVVTGGTSMTNLLDGRLSLAARPVESGICTSDLRQARVKLDSYDFTASLYMAQETELDTAAGLDVGSILREAGAILVGSRRQLLGDTGRARRHSCVVFPTESDVPVLAFLLTRVLPLKHMWFAPDSTKGPRDYKPPPMVQETGRRVYVILLELPSVGAGYYVGETGIAVTERFRQHKIGYKHSRHAHKYGLRLVPDLYEREPVFGSNDESKAGEADLYGRLKAQGYTVRGGH